MLKPNCQKCFYGGMFRPYEGLASCSCEQVVKDVVYYHDDLFKVRRKGVKRTSWDEECSCEMFTPDLSETEGDFTLEPVCYFTTSFDCPCCGEEIYVDDIGIEEVKHVQCDSCGMLMVVRGKSL